ncbi:MAG: 2-succinyl-5-enolpyruvyl-6-hydroxy-3-cyclohexene-1-carboxylic-acid synthase [Deltaproteobacteria bacterium]|nr:2-succinyl-5-enolpyruvyl-6-hydroxy-3-cyclohexene-1-carboxylic-acid synthase [Deltaproteobacteria bacterium]
MKRANFDTTRELFSLLAAGGVRDVVISPGARSAPLAFAAEGTARLRTHVTIDERVGSFFALGLARSTGSPTVFVCTSGSAGAHALPAILESRYGGGPLVVITADRPGELWDCGASQTVRQARYFGEHALSFSIETPHEEGPTVHLRTLVAQVLTEALRQPVHLNVPLREPLKQDAPRREAPSHVEVLRGKVAPSIEALETVERRIEGRRGVIVVGPAHEGRLGPAAHRLAAALSWPVIAEPASGGSLGFAGPRLVSSAAAFLPSPAVARQLRPEVIVRLGRPPTANAVSQWLERAGADVIVFEAGARYLDPQHSAKLVIEGDPERSCDWLAGRVRSIDESWLRAFRRVDDSVRAVLDEAAATGFWEGTIARELLRRMPSSWALHVGNSSPIRDLELFGGPGTSTRRVLSSRGVCGIDGGIATALGEARGLEAPVVAYLGELAVQHDAGALLAMRQLGGDVMILMVDNGGGGIFRTLPFASESDPTFQRLCLTPSSMDVEALCRAGGVAYSRATREEELASAIARASFPSLVHVIVNGSASHGARVRALAEAGRAAARSLDLEGEIP